MKALSFCSRLDGFLLILRQSDHDVGQLAPIVSSHKSHSTSLRDACNRHMVASLDMGERTGISWTDATFNAWLGCQRVSPGCDNCYAERGSKRFAAQHGLKLWDGDRHVTSDDYWTQPRVWNAAAAKAARPRRVFCGSWCDIAEMGSVQDAARERLWPLVESTPWLIWQLLTKRPENLHMVLPARWLESPPENVWLGTTCEDQTRLDYRLPALLQIPARVHFVSAEPLLHSITLRDYRPEWVIIGGESGPRARYFAPLWAMTLIDECRDKRVAPFVKQMGSVWAKENGSRSSHGSDPYEWVPSLRVQEFPS